MIPFLELRPAYLELKEEFDEAYDRVMDSGWFLLGDETHAFEREYADYCGTKHCVTVGTGLDALLLSLRAYGIGPGDEVIVPSHTFIATWLAVEQTGATIVPVEPDAATFNISHEQIAAAITSKTKAILPVHLYGQMADMQPILELAEENGIIVLTDAAQSHGATYRGRKSGSVGYAAAHSFYPGKNLGAFSDGGAVTTNDESIANRVRELRNYGSTAKYHHESVGTNSRIDELQAAFLRIKLRHLDAWNSRRVKIAETYLDLLSVENLTLPVTNPEAESVWHLFVVRVRDRDALRKKLAEDEISTLIHYPVPAHLSGAFQHLGYGRGAFPVAEQASATVLSLPIGPQQSQESTEIVAATVNAAFGI